MPESPTASRHLVPSSSLHPSDNNRDNNPFETPFDDDSEEIEADAWWDHEALKPDMLTAQSTANSRVTHWPKLNNANNKGAPKPPQGLGIRKSIRQYSVHKPTRDKSKGRQKKQNALAGIRVVTDFSRTQAPPTVQPRQVQPAQTLQPGCFVNLAALQALESQPVQSSGSWWSKNKHTKNNLKDEDSNVQGPRIELNTPTTIEQSLQRNRKPAQLQLESDLSPDDRPIVIGLSIPSARLNDTMPNTPQTACSETSKIIQSYQHRTPLVGPETPTIVITPANERSVWSPDTPSTAATSRIPSSIYSHTTNGVFIGQHMGEIPPVPSLPHQYAGQDGKALQANTNRDTVDSFLQDVAGQTNPVEGRRERVISSHTVFEEDESPIVSRKTPITPVEEKHIRARSASNSTTATHRKSKGWWTFITTPFITTAKTFPPTEKEKNPEDFYKSPKSITDQRNQDLLKTFSPSTPRTETSVSSDEWWDVNHDLSTDRKKPFPFETRDSSTGTVPKHRVQIAGDGLAANFDVNGENGPVRSRRASYEQSPERGLTRQESASSSFSPVDREVPVVLKRSLTEHQRLNNYVQPRSEDLREAPRQLPELSRNLTSQVQRNSSDVSGFSGFSGSHAAAVSSPEPPPYSPPKVHAPRHKAVYPPNRMNQNVVAPATSLQQPPSPGPVSPGLQQAMTSQGAIPLSDVPLTPAARQPIVLDAGYPHLPARQQATFVSPAYFEPPPTKARKAEKKRRKYEKEDKVAHKAGGLWRGRRCVPKRGCYGRSGAEGRKRRRCCFGWLAGFIALLILIIVLATTLHHKKHIVEQESQWLNLTGFPPIFTGVATIAVPDAVKENTGCVFPTSLWSCALPKELQSTVAPNQPDQPNFRLDVRWDNSSAANATFSNVTDNPAIATRAVGNAVSAGQLIKRLVLMARQVTYTPSPAAPSLAEQFFLGNTTDGIVSSSKAGEATPFYISFLSISNSSTTLSKRSTSSNTTNPFPDISALLPSPASNSDGTAAPANLLPSPLPTSQPLRLFDRNLPTEHYGFYTYYDRSIFLKSTALLNVSDTGDVPDDLNGGATESEAKVRCTWAQTRFLVQIWTRMGNSSALLNSTSPASTSSSQVNTTTAFMASDFNQPGSFPYPVTLTLDRHGGNATAKMVYCYALDDRERQTPGEGKLVIENRGFGGTLLNSAPGLFGNATAIDDSAGGFDGGTGGCGCEWQNFVKNG